MKPTCISHWRFAKRRDAALALLLSTIIAQLSTALAQSYSIDWHKIAKLPMTEWNYKGYGDRHVGPMAQDFHAAFPFNANDKMINSADEAGVSLAAIQGLNQKLNEKDAEIQDLKARLEKLEQMVNAKEGAAK